MSQVVEVGRGQLSGKLLVVEDAQSDRMNLQRALEDLFSERIEYATGAEDAERLIDSTVFSHVVLDLALPDGRQGIDVFERIVAKRALPDVIIYTKSEKPFTSYMEHLEDEDEALRRSYVVKRLLRKNASRPQDVASVFRELYDRDHDVVHIDEEVVQIHGKLLGEVRSRTEEGVLVALTDGRVVEKRSFDAGIIRRSGLLFEGARFEYHVYSHRSGIYSRILPKTGQEGQIRLSTRE